MTDKETNQLSIERDVLGTMLINGSISQALLRNVIAKDFKFNDTRTIFSFLRDISDRRGKFQASDVLGSNIEQNRNILHLMNDCLTSNLDVKCIFLTEEKQ